MSREIRKVPKNWIHPKNEYDNYVWMFYAWEFDFWKEEYKEWVENYKIEMKEYNENPEDWDYIEPKYPKEPQIEDFVPVGDYFQLYETTSEWSPVSDTFETIEELTNHLVTVWDYHWEVWTEKSITYLLDDVLIPTAIIENWEMKRWAQQ